MVQIFPFTPKSLSVNNLMKFKEHLVHILAKLFSFVNSLGSL